MLFLYEKHYLLFSVLRVGMACFVFFYSTDLTSSLSPFSRLKPIITQEEGLTQQEISILFTLLYSISEDMNTAHSHGKSIRHILKIYSIPYRTGLPVSVEEIVRFTPQPEVTYYVVKINGTIRILRVFNMSRLADVYPARIFMQTDLPSSENVIQFISLDSYRVIEAGEEKIVKKISTVFTRWWYSLAMCINLTMGLHGTLSKFIGAASPFLDSGIGVLLSIILICAVMFPSIHHKVNSRLGWVNKNIMSQNFNTKHASLQCLVAENDVKSFIKKLKKASKKESNILIGIETDWISDNRTRKQINKILKNLSKAHNKNITFVLSNSKNIFDDIVKKMNEPRLHYSNIVVIVSKKSLDADRDFFRWLEKEKAACIGIDNTEVNNAFGSLRKGDSLFVNVPEILEAALKIGLDKELTEPKNVEIYYEYPEGSNFIIFKLKPCVVSERLANELYNAQIRFLHSA